jgi:hypothetical protein
MLQNCTVLYITQTVNTHLANCNDITIFVRRMERSQISVPGIILEDRKFLYNPLKLNEERECGNNVRLIKAADCGLFICRQGQTTMVEVGGGPNKTASLCLLFHATLNQPKM